MKEYNLMDENGKPVTFGNIDVIYRIDSTFFGENYRNPEKSHTRNIPVNGSEVCIFYRENGCSRVIIPKHEEDTKKEFESKARIRLEEITCQ